ncbi:branched-chain amino acid aminotransferase [Ameyamaea chiangmaiensis NBRC 103196]|uniref:Branched-chain-amino-acid aminotransferase n=1 Tax=Ameyamaea chiangmaiensis TaxID=442969 RepID=A0A850PDU2_9PROT|nr:branched-chain amino acid aminotransferase [Ameyamaea chiangmaiensis]MBS4073793.1 branched-chain amino acid aminotransferase [Ameyamaea chiangmaiensis]NVN39211.1 branched-chain amino acid aminotransferase [Ameyamaea chiangmaiensis]GBQ68430.1 branched-chain amino acid aminotransferase [Ameyamaea chiangmaiensis NBRC 103196]
MSGDKTFDFTVTRSAHPVADAKREAILANPGFGKAFTDHMVMIDWNIDKGWYNPRVVPYGPLSLDPATSVLHYAQEIFEGMKAYRSTDNVVRLFRPEANAARFNQSAARMAMAQLPEDLFVEAVNQLVRIDRGWIPTGEGQSLYLRPFMFANGVYLGVKPSSDYLFMVIASPVGSYFSGKAVNVWVSENYTRAAPGGTGAAKCGGNYAAGLLAQAEASEHECDQVLFLDAVERKWVEEMGGMNIFFVRDDKTIVTPPLGTILPGITRNAVMTMAREQGYTVVEEPLAIDQIYADAASGRITEAFACGTAAVITPIGAFRHAAGTCRIGLDGSNGPVTGALRDGLVNVQRGTAPDTHGWVHTID